MGYYDHKFKLSFVLDDISERGLPVDREKQEQLRDYIISEETRLLADLQQQIPQELLPANRKTGYIGLPKDLRALLKERGVWVKGVKLDHYITNHYDLCNQLGYYWKDFGSEEDPFNAGLVKLLPFNPNSADQLLDYIRYKGHRVPKHIDTGKDTTGKDEIEKLIEETNDDVLRVSQKMRKLTKLKGTYCSGEWIPGPDGRVHATFRFGTASGQTSATKPNCFSPDTDILTLRGWIRFDQLLRTDKVAQYYAETGWIDFTEPSFVKGHSDFLYHIFTEQQIDLLVTPDHRCLLRNRKSGDLKIFSAADYPEDKQQIQAGAYVGGTVRMDQAQLILIAALQADGHVLKARNRYKGGGITFAFSRMRKANRLRTTLNNLKIPYRESRGLAQKPEHNNKVLFSISSQDVPEWLRDKKFFGDWVLSLDRASFQFLADEVFHWDGLLSGRQYCSSDEINSEWVQVLMTLTRRRAHPRLYRDAKAPNMRVSHQLDITNRDSSMTTNCVVRQVPHDGPVYCVSVPTGYIVTRHNKRVAITGNCQQFPEHYNPEDEWIADIVKRMKACIRAEPGHKLVKVDARGAHGRMQGWLAEDPDYYRLANLDLHSYNTAHYIGVPDKDTLLALDDISLMKRLKEIKSEYEYDRNYKLKRVAYLMQFMGGAEKAFKILTAFESVYEVSQLIDMIKRLFPRSFVDFPASVEQQMRKHPRLISPHGACRWMWDLDLQQGVAFTVSNPFHCHIQSALVRLFEQGVFSKFECVNFTHDAVWLHPHESLVEDAIAAVKVEFERPSDVLVNSLGPFVCLADAQVGDQLSEMSDV